MEGLNLSKEVSTKQQFLWQNPTETNLTLEKDIVKDLKIKNSGY